MKIIARCGLKSKSRLTIFSEVKIILDTIVYYKRHLNDDIKYRLLDEMWEE